MSAVVGTREALLELRPHPTPFSIGWSGPNPVDRFYQRWIGRGIAWRQGLFLRDTQMPALPGAPALFVPSHTRIMLPGDRISEMTWPHVRSRPFEDDWMDNAGLVHWAQPPWVPSATETRDLDDFCGEREARKQPYAWWTFPRILFTGTLGPDGLVCISYCALALYECAGKDMSGNLRQPHNVDLRAGLAYIGGAAWKWLS